MKRIALVVGIMASLAISQIANATPVTSKYDDNALNWATWTATSHNSNDPWGYPSIESTSVTTEQIGQKSELKNVTFNLNQHDFSIVSGDLFIDAGSNLTWDYVVRSLGTTLNGNAILSLYSLNSLDYNSATANIADYKLSYGHTPSSSIRADLPVGLMSTPNATSLLGNVGYIADASKISFDFGGLGSNSLLFASSYIIGYEVSCGNDIVYQEVPVPEPGTMMLLGFGMLGLAVIGKRRMNRQA